MFFWAPACTDKQVEKINHIVSTNAHVLACEADLNTTRIFSLPNDMAPCNVTSCTSAFTSLYNTLPQCRSDGTSYKLDAYEMLTNCGIDVSDDNTDDSAE